jgi:hypothetical protein
VSALLQGGTAGTRALSFARNPAYLRVVVDQDGSVDALDQIEDTPKPTEKIYVYRQGEQIFVCGRGTAPTQNPTFFYFPVPLDAQTLESFRDNEVWRAWCMSQPYAADQSAADA